MLLEGKDLKALTTSYLTSQSKVDTAADAVFEELVDEIALGICFEIHKAAKTGVLPCLDVTSNESSPGSSDLVPGHDVFGQVITTNVGVPTLKKQPECICPNCQRNLAAVRFAPHLEKCMGMGRNSSRLASRRKQKENVYRDGNDDEDDAEDEDWIEPPKNLNRKKRDRNSPRRTKGIKSKNGESLSDGSITPPTNYDQLSIEERATLLQNICGVLSISSRKICTRSLRCPVHNDTQRREVRIRWLHHGDEDAHVDIDSFTEGDTAALRESLSQLSNESSPAESTISSGSHQSLSRGGRRDKSRRGNKKGRPGSKNGSRGSTPPLLE